MVGTVIPARGGSKGIPRKNLRVIQGKPLVAYAIEIAQHVEANDVVLVSTDDPEIASIAGKYGADVIKRPPHLAMDSVNLLPVNQHALGLLREKGTPPDILISLQPTAPMVNPVSIDKAIELIGETGCDSVCSIAEIEHNHPYRAKRFDRPSGKLENFLDIDGDSYLQKQDLPECFAYTGGFYVRRADVLACGTGKGLGVDIRGIVVSPREALDIDTPLDLEFFRFLLRREDADDSGL